MPQMNKDQTRDAFDDVSAYERDVDVGDLILADGDLFELPGAQGRLERLDFGNGMYLHRAELYVREDSYFNVKNSLPPGWLSGAINVMGTLEVECPEGKLHSMSPDAAMVMRVDPLGTRYFLPAGQVIRHVGVVSTLDPLRERFGDRLPAVMAPFLSDRQDVVLIKPVPTSNRMRSIVSAMFSPHVTGLGHKFKLEGLSTLFLAELIDSYRALSEADNVAPELTTFEKSAHDAAVSKITRNPGAAISVPQLAVDVGVSESRLNSLFKIEMGKSCGEFIRSERMALAQELLIAGDMTVKQIAEKVGFNHVSNFSRSYRDWFGESPASALRRK